MPQPTFSIVITTYNRVTFITRCVDSCLAQSFTDFEVVVVDDASSDETESALHAKRDPRLRVYRHEFNRGIDPSRHSGVSHARGRWVLVIDSDWELFPHSLQRLHEIIEDLPPDIRVIRARLILDDGRMIPFTVPHGPVGYVDRLRWVEEEGGHDDLRCVHRSVLETNPYFHNRRGAMEPLYELNLAKSQTALHVDEVLAREYLDAPNSYLRTTSRQALIPRLLREAPDLLWMVSTALYHHGSALHQYGPREYRKLLRMASLQAFLVGDRKSGMRYSFRYLRSKRADPVLWLTLILGLAGPKAVAHGVFLFRLLARSGPRVRRL